MSDDTPEWISVAPDGTGLRASCASCGGRPFPIFPVGPNWIDRAIQVHLRDHHGRGQVAPVRSDRGPKAPRLAAYVDAPGAAAVLSHSP